MASQIELSQYSIYLGDQLHRLSDHLQAVDASKTFVLVDENTHYHCWPKMQMHVHVAPEHIIQIKAGEEFKRLDTCQTVWKHLMDHGADRKSVLINLGGGVIGDLGGFCASTYMRGIPFIQIPTTLLAQVDASVCGKLGIDNRGVKNILGSFSDPIAGFIEPDFLDTLPIRELRSGFAEIIKHALIRDADQWSDFQSIDELERVQWLPIIDKSLEIKKAVVQQDPREKGLRKILNFGHTIGHAVESVMMPSNDKLLHGEAIAIGMIAEAFLSTKLAGLPSDQLAAISSYLLRIFGKVNLDPSQYESIMELMMLDKKNEKGMINFSLLHQIGYAQENYFAHQDAIIESLKYYGNL